MFMPSPSLKRPTWSLSVIDHFNCSPLPFAIIMSQHPPSDDMSQYGSGNMK